MTIITTTIVAIIITFIIIIIRTSRLIFVIQLGLAIFSESYQHQHNRYNI